MPKNGNGRPDFIGQPGLYNPLVAVQGIAYILSSIWNAAEIRLPEDPQAGPALRITLRDVHQCTRCRSFRFRRHLRTGDVCVFCQQGIAGLISVIQAGAAEGFAFIALDFLFDEIMRIRQYRVVTITPAEPPDRPFGVTITIVGATVCPRCHRFCWLDMMSQENGVCYDCLADRG